MSKKVRVLTVFGTRPEAIKMAPLVKEFESRPEEFESFVCVSAQHREMLDSVLNLFEIKPDFDLDIMRKNQNLHEITSTVLVQTKKVYEEVKPDIVLVHGDTTTAAAAALSAFYLKIPVGHIEAGLRTFDKFNPFPEEINRVLADAVSSYMFAPTDTSVKNLIDAGCDPERVYKTGNTVIDALLYVLKNKPADISKIVPNNGLKTILVTAHRRENFGEPLENICKALIEITEKEKDVQIVYPVHPNPNVKGTAERFLAGKERIILTPPADYAPFSCLMKHACLILSDSGGIQEEAPSLGKPVLVLRKTTERPEAVEYGTVKLVGTETENIVNEVQKLLHDENEYKKMSEAINPYGDGTACRKTADTLVKIFG